MWVYECLTFSPSGRVLMVTGGENGPFPTTVFAATAKLYWRAGVTLTVAAVVVLVSSSRGAGCRGELMSVVLTT